MNNNPRSWPDKVAGASMSILVSAGAVFIAVKLIEAVFTGLLIIVGVGLFIACAVALGRSRNRGW